MIRSVLPTEFTFNQIHDFVRDFIHERRFEGKQTLYISKIEFNHWKKVMLSSMLIFTSKIIKEEHDEMIVMGQKVKYYD